MPAFGHLPCGRKRLNKGGSLRQSLIINRTIGKNLPPFNKLTIGEIARVGNGWQSFAYPYDFNRENAKGGSEVRQVVKDQHHRAAKRPQRRGATHGRCDDDTDRAARAACVPATTRQHGRGMGDLPAPPLSRTALFGIDCSTARQPTATVLSRCRRAGRDGVQAHNISARLEPGVNEHAHRHAGGGGVTRRRRRSPVFAMWLAIQARGPVCARWRSFGTFYRDVGKQPTWRHLLCRDDSSREFSPSNARWQVAKWYRRRPSSPDCLT